MQVEAGAGADFEDSEGLGDQSANREKAGGKGGRACDLVGLGRALDEAENGLVMVVERTFDRVPELVAGHRCRRIGVDQIGRLAGQDESVQGTGKAKRQRIASRVSGPAQDSAADDRFRAQPIGEKAEKNCGEG